MILDPVNDQQCLGLLVERARELVRTRMAYDAAARLRTVRAVINYLRSLPQLDDDGSERVQLLACDVPQRLRFMPSDPNCFERTLAALVLLELIDPKTERVPISVDKPERHTGIVERQPGGAWQPIDLFPRRNSAAQDVLGVVHPIGRGVLGIFGLGSVGDRLGRVWEQHGWLRPEDGPSVPPPRTPALSRTSPRYAQQQQPTHAPPASRRAPERDPELRRAPDSQQPFSELGGPEHGDEEDTEAASSSHPWPPRRASAGARAISGARATRARPGVPAGAGGCAPAAQAKRLWWGR